MSEKLKTEIQAINNRYAAMLAKGWDGVGQFFAEDADLLPPGFPNMKGPKAIESFWRAALAGAERVTLTTDDAVALGSDFVREIGRYHGAYKDKSIPAVNGKYVFIWRKVGADWKIWTDIWTSDTGQT
jgi:ketosteroid isomerase-like protein